MPNPNHQFEFIPEFSSQGNLSIVNTQKSTLESDISRNMLAKYTACTDAAISITEDGPQSALWLNLSINDVRNRAAWGTISTEIDMSVYTGNSYSARYTSRNSSVMMADPPWQVIGALSRRCSYY